MAQKTIPNDYAEKTNIVDNDLIMVSDSQDGNKLKRAKKSNIVKSVQDFASVSPDFYKYSIVRTVNSGNLTVALKNYLGQDPSTSAPVKVQIGDTVRTITSALSVTINAGGAWFNAGSSELTTKEVDLFVYLQGIGSTADIGFARIPYANTYSDFVASNISNGTSEKYFRSNFVSQVSTDPVVNIGRFNAILSAGYTWSIPATSVIINRPVYESRKMYQNIIVGDGTNLATITVNSSSYILDGNTVKIIQDITIDNKGSCSGTVRSYLPFSVDGAIPLAGSIKGGKGGIGTPICYLNFITFNNSTTSFSELQWSDITNGDRFIVSGDYFI